MPTELTGGYSLLQSFQYVICAKFIEIHLQLRQFTEKIKLMILGYSSMSKYKKHHENYGETAYVCIDTIKEVLNRKTWTKKLSWHKPLKCSQNHFSSHKYI